MNIMRAVGVSPVSACAIVLAIGVGASECRAQSPLTLDTGWALAPAGGGVPNPYALYVRVGTAANGAYDP
ncbi:MAG: hypothetical protein JNJ48_08860, partial [Phycisphaerae bacterium]|nr:hypothetical protein [Phycisphaerae bacterium]